MLIALHKNAHTTPAIRAEMAASTQSASALARQFSVSVATACKWMQRPSTRDLSHTAHRLQTTLTLAQERVAVELRRTLLLPLDDLLAVMREFVCERVSSRTSGWTGACVATAWATSTPSSRPHLQSRTTLHIRICSRNVLTIVRDATANLRRVKPAGAESASAAWLSKVSPNYYQTWH